MAFQYNGYLGQRALARASASSPLPAWRPMTNTPLRGNSSRSQMVAYKEPKKTSNKSRRVYNPTIVRRYRKKRRLTVKVPRSNTGSTFSYYTGGRTRMSKNIYSFWTRTQKYIVSKLFSSKLSISLYGKQAILNTSSIISSDFNDDLTRCSIPSTTAYQKSSNSLIYGTVTDITTFTNVELTTTYLHIYEITPRYNTSNTPVDDWNNGLSDEESTLSDDASNAYEKPFRSQKFCLMHNVNKVYQIELLPGQTHKHTSKYGINRVVNGAVANMSVYTKYFTYHRMYVASGTPINDMTNKSLVSTSTVSLDIVTNRTYSVSQDSRTRTQTITFNTLNNVTSAQVVSEAVIEADGNA